MIAFKVLVNGDENGGLSTNANIVYKDTADDFILRYEKGQVTQPKVAGSKLFVFKKLEDAQRFSGGPGTDVWRCEVPNLSIPKFRAKVFCNHYGADFKNFWDRKAKHAKVSNIFDYSTVVRGARLTDWVRLIEKVS